tara:strand:+ start:1397 stop:1543 length:147 start_codon:yes stop_codon:yes gene_type:complete
MPNESFFKSFEKKLFLVFKQNDDVKTGIKSWTDERLYFIDEIAAMENC